MNINRLEQLAASLEHGSEGMTFDMRAVMLWNGRLIHYVPANHQGLSGCAAGLACLKWGEVNSLVSVYDAAILLDITMSEARAIFINENGFISQTKRLYEITSQDVTEAIRRLVEMRGLQKC